MALFKDEFPYMVEDPLVFAGEGPGSQAEQLSLALALYLDNPEFNENKEHTRNS